MRFFLAAILSGCLAFSAEAHSPLLPKPRQVRYGGGSLNLRDLQIILPEQAATEDRFATSQLVAQVLRRTGISIPVVTAGKSRKAITLLRSGGIEALPQPGETTGPDSREGYRLTVNQEGVTLHSRTSAGLFYAAETLSQLVEVSDGGGVIPFVEIQDWPTTAYRGTMIDMSEGPLATEEEVLRQLDFIAGWKGNQYYFYNEDSIELTGYSLLNPQAQFSKAQIRHIIAYARERHIDVIPCLELYGHQHDLFRIEKYSSLADFPHGGEFDPANPKVQEILADWTQQYLELFPSSFVHIGFDETWEIARAARVKGSGFTPARLFLTQLNAVAERFIAHGKFVLAWGDIVVKFPDIAAQIPANVAIVPWWYEPDPDPLYGKWLAPLIANHVPMFVAAGVNMWSEMTPDFAKSLRNIDTLLAAGKQGGALGLINTVWTDNQEGLRRLAWPGIAYGAVAAWQSTPIAKDIFFDEYARGFYPAACAVDMAAGLQALSSAESLAQNVWGAEDMDAQWSSPFEVKSLASLRKHRTDLENLRLKAEEAQSHFMAAQTGDCSAGTFLFGSRVLDYAGMRSLYALEIEALWARQQRANGADSEVWELLSSSFSRTHGRVGDLMDSLSLLIPDYRANWLAEYTPYRLETGLLRWNMEHRYWWRAQNAFDQFRERYRKGAPLPSLEVLIGRYGQ